MMHSPDRSRSHSSCSGSSGYDSHSTATMFNNHYYDDGDSISDEAPPPSPTTMVRLVIREQPVSNFRFRYKSELAGTHGVLNGSTKDTFPTVELVGYDDAGADATADEPVVIVCSLRQAIGPNSQRLHSHSLEVRRGRGRRTAKKAVTTMHPTADVDPLLEYVSARQAESGGGYRAEFRGMGIIHTGKAVNDELCRKMVRRELLFASGARDELSELEMERLRRRAAEQAAQIDLNQVCLGFEAFRKRRSADGRGWVFEQLCAPVFSVPISNKKCAQTGELKITRMSVTSCDAAGNSDLFIFIEKVDKKDIQVRFYEEDGTGQLVWEDFGQFEEADVHHQYAIALRTPPYRNVHIRSDVKVFVQLHRQLDNCYSVPLPFCYTAVRPLIEEQEDEEEEEEEEIETAEYYSWPGPKRTALQNDSVTLQVRYTAVHQPIDKEEAQPVAYDKCSNVPPDSKPTAPPHQHDSGYDENSNGLALGASWDDVFADDGMDWNNVLSEDEPIVINDVLMTQGLRLDWPAASDSHVFADSTNNDGWVTQGLSADGPASESSARTKHKVILTADMLPGLVAAAKLGDAKSKAVLIHVIRKSANRRRTSADAVESDEVTNHSKQAPLFDAICLRELCAIFNVAERWRPLAAMLNMSELMIGQVGQTLDEDPTRRLLDYAQMNGYGGQRLASVFEHLNNREALVCLDEMTARRLEKE